MSRNVSMNARLSHDAMSSDEVEVALIRITHPSLDEPVRLSTDPTERISDDPLMYGTLSDWLTEDGSPFLFALMSARVPGDEQDSPPQAAITFENVDNEIAGVLRSFTDRATFDIAVVLASTPNRVEADWRGLKVISASGDAASVTLTISLDPITAEPWPSGRMTRQRFPGMHR
ncbi:MAG: hypothetical protein JWR80_156 [Bradyrhizobium sp.]|nr:hypothetical protein [Bradyrhizobium sp.]